MNAELLQSLVGKMVKIDRGGPESREGKVLGVSNNYFAISTEKEGVIYYLSHHIKSITENMKKGFETNEENESEENKSKENKPKEHVTETPSFIIADDFSMLIENFRYRWVKVNRGGKESLVGVVDDVNADYLTLITGEEVIRISMFHVRNIGYDPKVKKQNDDSKDKKDDSKKDNDDSKNKKDEK